MFRQLLHDLRKVDRCEEVAPRKLGQELDLLLTFLAVGEDDGAHHSLSRRFDHLIFGSADGRVLRKVEHTEPEEAS